MIAVSKSVSVILWCSYSYWEYFTGISSIIALAFWIMFTSNTPSTNRHISARERNYITNSLKGQISAKAPKVSHQ